MEEEFGWELKLKLEVFLVIPASSCSRCKVHFRGNLNSATVSKNQLDHLREVVDRPITFEYIIQLESFTIVATEKKKRERKIERELTGPKKDRIVVNQLYVQMPIG